MVPLNCVDRLHSCDVLIAVLTFAFAVLNGRDKARLRQGYGRAGMSLSLPMQRTGAGDI
jgi:hypothetical protein